MPYVFMSESQIATLNTAKRYDPVIAAAAIDLGDQLSNTPPSFSNATRGDSSVYPVGFAIWNTDDTAANYADGGDWRDAAGSIT